MMAHYAAQMRARVIVLAGPSGSGKSRLAERLALPLLRLDDFYRDGDDPALPKSDIGIVDWDDPASWDAASACESIDALCHDGHVDAPVYDIAANARVGHRELVLNGSAFIVAEGLFAPEIVAECMRRDLLADAICVRHPRMVTFVLRLVRDLREHRKPPLVLLRRGWRLLLTEPQVVAYAVARGCEPMSPGAAERRLGVLFEPSRR